VASGHRGDAFAACEFIMDYLKTRAPFWKKEQTAEGTRWVEAKAVDDQAAERWNPVQSKRGGG
jgi:molybdopterin synthase catalytic subunit